MSRSEVEGRYRKKPVTIQAVQLTGSSSQAYDVLQWIKGGDFPRKGGMQTADMGGRIEIETLEGTMTAKAGDWIIWGIKGEFYLCRPDIFAQTYGPDTGLKPGVPDTDTVEERVAQALYASKVPNGMITGCTADTQAYYRRLARAAIAALNGEDQV